MGTRTCSPISFAPRFIKNSVNSAVVLKPDIGQSDRVLQFNDLKYSLWVNAFLGECSIIRISFKYDFGVTLKRSPSNLLSSELHYASSNLFDNPSELRRP